MTYLDKYQSYRDPAIEKKPKKQNFYKGNKCAGVMHMRKAPKVIFLQGEKVVADCSSLAPHNKRYLRVVELVRQNKTPLTQVGIAKLALCSTQVAERYLFGLERDGHIARTDDNTLYVTRPLIQN